MTISDKLIKLNQIKTDLRTAINNKGVAFDKTLSFTQYPDKVAEIVINTEEEATEYDYRNIYTAVIDGSEIDTIAKRDTVIMKHCDNARSAGKTEMVFIFRGNIPRFVFSDGSTGVFNPTLSNPSKVLLNIQKVSIIFDSQAIKPKTLSTNFMFSVCSSLTFIPQLDMSNITNMGTMFSGCSSLTTIPDLDTSNVTNMEGTFNDCTSLKSIPQLDTSKVTNMRNIFYLCKSLTSIPLLDTSKVTNMSNMFVACGSLTTIPKLDTSNVNSMYIIFYSCRSLENIDMYGMKVSFSVEDTKLNATALNKLFTNLATVTTRQTITITGTPGASTCDRSIATSKGWTVIG